MRHAIGLTILATLSSAVVAVAIGAGNDGDLAPASLPEVVFPPENPFSEDKRVLGKILFWDEQLSSDNTVSCGTCHQPASAGTDPVPARDPGADNTFGTDDDEFTSFGVIGADAANNYRPVAPFGLEPQTTPRSTNPAITAMYYTELFWEGRAPSEFRDPQTGEVVIPVGGALESQAAAPIVSDVEMAHADRDWDQVTTKLESAVPLALATEIPPDMTAAIDAHPRYPDLFEAAFGDTNISAARIAMAIATYERTLVPDQAPWDRFMAGDQNAMTPAQQRGWFTFSNSRCVFCHVAPWFASDSYENIGLRPLAEDLGRSEVTGDPADRGKFKVSTLRNVGLKSTFMHTGQFTTLEEVIALYQGPGAPGNDNRNLGLPLQIPPQLHPGDLVAFLAEALTDPRVANEQFPFDRPTLFTERPDDAPQNLGGATAGAAGFVPRVIAIEPPNVGNADFKIGVDQALAATTAFVAISQSPPVDGVVPPDTLEGPITTRGQSPGEGYATFHWPIPADPSLDNQVFYLQWRIDDPEADGGIALSDAIQLTLFCGERCPSDCPADLDADGDADADDFFFYLDAFATGDLNICDIDNDTDCDAEDFFAYLDLFAAGC